MQSVMYLKKKLQKYYRIFQVLKYRKNRKIVAAEYSIAVYLVFYSRQPLEDCAFVHGRYRYDVSC